MPSLSSPPPDEVDASPGRATAAISPSAAVSIQQSPTPVRPIPSRTGTVTATTTATPTATDTTVPPSPTVTCDEVQGQVVQGTFFSSVIGQDQAYRVYLPPCYRATTVDYPTLYMLHGYPFDDSHWDDIGIDEAADVGISAGTLPSFVIAMPAADNEGTYTSTSGGPGSFEAVLMEEFLPFIEANYRVSSDGRERAIGGMSRGAVWSLEIAFRNPDHFVAVGAHSAALNVNRAPPTYDPLHLAADPSIHSLRIYLDSGRGDWVLPGVENLHAALDAAGVVHDFYIFEGNHDDVYWSSHVAEYLAFYAAGWTHER